MTLLACPVQMLHRHAQFALIMALEHVSFTKPSSNGGGGAGAAPDVCSSGGASPSSSSSGQQLPPSLYDTLRELLTPNTPLRKGVVRA